MGLTIYYSGRLSKPDALQPLIDEVQDIAQTFDWKFHVFERKFPNGKFTTDDYDDEIYGINITPEGSETFSFCFLSNGRMCCPSNLIVWGKDSHSPNPKFLYQLFTKTQFAGAAEHQKLISVIRHISSKYLIDFDLKDESNYWETNDTEILEESFRKHKLLIESFTDKIKNSRRKENESLEDFLKRLAKDLDEELRGGKSD